MHIKAGNASGFADLIEKRAGEAKHGTVRETIVRRERAGLGMWALRKRQSESARGVIGPSRSLLNVVNVQPTTMAAIAVQQTRPFFTTLRYAFTVSAARFAAPALSSPSPLRWALPSPTISA